MVKFLKRGQSISGDVMIATSLFIVGVMIFLFIVMSNTETKSLQELVSEAQKISDAVSGSEATVDENMCNFIINNRIDSGKLAKCAENYNISKQVMAVSTDWCIHFEDIEGNIVNISPITGKQGIGLGSPEINFTITDETGLVIGSAQCME